MNKIKISGIVLKPELTFLREDYNKEKINEYKEMYESGTSKPILIHRGTKILVDGFHRVKAFPKKLGEYIECEYIDCDKEDIRKKAIEINISHGIPLTKKERNEQIKILRVEEKRTQEEIGKVFKISRNRVAEILKSSGVSETDTFDDMVIPKFIEGEENATKISQEINCASSTARQIILDFKDKIKELYLTLSFPEKIVEELKEDKIEITEERLLEILEKIFDREEYLNKQIIHSDFLETNIKNVDLIVTDPPYNISASGGSHKKGNKIVTFNAGEWDIKGKEEFINKLFKGWLIKMKDSLKEGGSFYIFVDRYLISYIWDLCKEIQGLKPKNIITWHKTNPVPNARNNYNSATEFILFGVKAGKSYTFNNLGWDNMNNIFDAPICSGNERTEHPTQKPVGLLKNFINISSNEGDIVLDCFAGSGSIGDACLQLKRRFIMVEKEERYINIIKERLI